MKTTGKLLAIIFALLIVSCGSDKPWVGEWIPDNNKGGEMELLSDGTAKFIVDESDGYVSVSGQWTEIDGEPNKFKIKLDASTIKVSCDNAFGKIILEEVAKAMCSEEQIGTISEEGDFMKLNGGNGGFVRK